VAQPLSLSYTVSFLLDRLKHRIHNTRIPINNPRILFLVQRPYFVVPICFSAALMPYITPSPDDMRARIQQPSEEDLAVIAAEKLRLQTRAGRSARAARAVMTPSRSILCGVCRSLLCMLHDLTLRQTVDHGLQLHLSYILASWLGARCWMTAGRVLGAVLRGDFP
jgi:hypothetical protein